MTNFVALHSLLMDRAPLRNRLKYSSIQILFELGKHAYVAAATLLTSSIRERPRLNAPVGSQTGRKWAVFLHYGYEV
jgi:hypothetical protein